MHQNSLQAKVNLLMLRHFRQVLDLDSSTHLQGVF